MEKLAGGTISNKQLKPRKFNYENKMLKIDFSRIT